MISVVPKPDAMDYFMLICRYVLYILTFVLFLGVRGAVAWIEERDSSLTFELTQHILGWGDNRFGGDKRRNCEGI